jgi:sulfur-oxidizing protein SoxY
MIYARPNRLSRRHVLVGLLGCLLVPLGKARSADALPEKLLPLIRQAAGGVLPQVGRVSLTLPTLAESGHSVRLRVRVESPMTPQAHVKQIHLFSEKNPRPVIARFSLGPQAGRAEVHTRIRLAGTQQVVAVAVMNDGTAWMASAEVVVTAAACVEGS